MILDRPVDETFFGRKSAFCNDCGTILVAGGDRNWVCNTSNALEALGYHTLTAFSADHALKIMSGARVLRIPTVIIESELPDGEGIGLVQTLSSFAARQGQRLNSILATMQPKQDMAMGVYGSSMTYVVDKSCGPRELDNILQRFRTHAAEPQSVAALSTQIEMLSEEMRSLKLSLEQVVGKEPRPVDPPAPKPRQIDADLVRKLTRVEAARASVIGGKILGDPAWNILLDLLLASLEGRRVAVSSACIVTGVATTTALRLINRMIRDGVLVRVPDEADGRRDYLHIAPDVETALKGYLFDLTQL